MAISVSGRRNKRPLHKAETCRGEAGADHLGLPGEICPDEVSKSRGCRSSRSKEKTAIETHLRTRRARGRNRSSTVLTKLAGAAVHFSGIGGGADRDQRGGWVRWISLTSVGMVTWHSMATSLMRTNVSLHKPTFSVYASEKQNVCGTSDFKAGLWDGSLVVPRLQVLLGLEGEGSCKSKRSSLLPSCNRSLTVLARLQKHRPVVPIGDWKGASRCRRNTISHRSVRALPLEW